MLSVEGRSKMNKGELIDALRNHWGNRDPAWSGRSIATQLRSASCCRERGVARAEDTGARLAGARCGPTCAGGGPSTERVSVHCRSEVMHLSMQSVTHFGPKWPVPARLRVLLHSLWSG